MCNTRHLFLKIFPLGLQVLQLACWAIQHASSQGQLLVEILRKELKVELL